jgi:hypothetical protein
LASRWCTDEMIKGLVLYGSNVAASCSGPE